MSFYNVLALEKKISPDSLSLALGTATITPLELARGYAVFANEGHLIDPYLVDHVIDLDNQTVYQADPKQVITNNEEQSPTEKNKVDKSAPQVIDNDVSYLMNITLRDAVKHGTGRRALVLQRNDLAGKTGTTNDKHDAWFSGYSPDLVTVVWAGFDQPNSLHEYGSQLALPIWINFMRDALQGKPERALERPANIVTARINAENGLLATSHTKHPIYESFRSRLLPGRDQQNLASHGRQNKHLEEPIF